MQYKKKQNFSRKGNESLLRGSVPEFDELLFKEHIGELHDLCSRITREKDPVIEQLMRNYVVVRIKSVLEYHLKAFISRLIDNPNLNIKAADVLTGEITLDVDVLDNLKDKKFSKGTILAAFMEQIPPGIVSSVMSQINDVDFFKWLQELLEIQYENVHKKKVKTSETIFKHIQKMNQERNDVIHNLKNTDFSAKELDQQVDAFDYFILRTFKFSVINLAIKNNISSEKINKDLQHVNITKKQFEEITLRNPKFQKQN